MIMPSRKQSIFILLILLAVALTSFTWGVITMHRKVFPYELVRSAAHAVLGGRASVPKPDISVSVPKVRKPHIVSFFDEFVMKADVVMIGDSVTRGALWNEIFPDLRIANRGVGGDMAKDILKRMDSIFAVEPSKAFLMMGTNDLKTDRSINEIFENYVNVVTRLQNRGIVVYIQSTIECSKSVCGTRFLKVRELNQKLRNYAVSNDIQYIDINKSMSSEADGLLPAYTHDGIHPTAKGYRVWSRAIRPYIEVN